MRTFSLCLLNPRVVFPPFFNVMTGITLSSGAPHKPGSCTDHNKPGIRLRSFSPCSNVTVKPEETVNNPILILKRTHYSHVLEFDMRELKG